MKRFSTLFTLLCLSLVRFSNAAPSALEERIAWEDKLKGDGSYILPYKPNYFMPLSYNATPNEAPYAGTGTELQKFETQFQISFKIPVTHRLFQWNIATYLAYTQVSFWQAFNHQSSALFRDTNYEPEFFLQFNTPHALGSWSNRFNRLGYIHQSNGQSDPLSRSWNRLYAEFMLDHANTMISIKPWYRLKGPAADDNNPDISKYMGPGELRGAWKIQEHVLSLLLRDNLWTTNNKGAVELAWSFPLIQSMKGYVQYFYGYGESLLDYNHLSNRASVGIAFSNWL